MRPHRHKRGFTLVEIILVIIIIGILAAIIVPKFAGQSDKAKIATTKANVNSIRSAVRLFQSDNEGTPPAALADLVTTYLRELPKEAITGSAAVKVGLPADNTGGWVYDAGEVYVNLTGNDVEGNAYSSY